MAHKYTLIECIRRMRKANFALLLVTAAMFSFSLTSCYVDSGWSPEPPGGWNDTFYDRDLNGCWELVQINSHNVSGYDVNYLWFGGNGRGRYYYYVNGQRYWEQTAYWCQYSNSGSSDYQINLQYENGGAPTTMNYWFTNGRNTLWMQWRNSYGLQTYVYDYIGDVSPW